MTKRIVSCAIALTSGALVFASTNQKQVQAFVDKNPAGLKLEDLIIDVDAVAGPILASLKPEQRAALAAVGVNPTPKTAQDALPGTDAADAAGKQADSAPKPPGRQLPDSKPLFARRSMRWTAARAFGESKAELTSPASS